MAKPYSVSRQVQIAAAPDMIHPLIDDLRQWQAWSPWEGLDPLMRRDYSGPERGVGARYAWEGNKQAGKGSMTITGSQPDQIDLDLRFDKPFPADNKIVFTLTPAGDGTRVQWRMDGTLNPLMRVFSLIRSMDSMVGPDFEKGLLRLRDAAQR